MFKVKSIRSGKIYTEYSVSGSRLLIWDDGWYYEDMEHYEPVED